MLLRLFKVLLTFSLVFVYNLSFSETILMFVSQDRTYYSEYIVMKAALEAQGYSVEVRSASTDVSTIYMTPYADIPASANDLNNGSYVQFQTQFQNLFGVPWSASHNLIPNDIPVDGAIQDVTDMTGYAGLVVVGGEGALFYRVDGDYAPHANITAATVEAAALKLNTLAVEALLDGKPVMAQCHGASIPAFWRIPGTAEDVPPLGRSILEGSESTGYPEDETAPMLAGLGITNKPNDRVTISSPHSSFNDNGSGDSKIITTMDWYPQTVAYAARTFLNILDTYPSESDRTTEKRVLILHGGAMDVPDCGSSNRDNDVPCNYYSADGSTNTTADYTHLQALLDATMSDGFDFNTEDLDLSGSLPADMLAHFNTFDAVIFFKHWSTHLTDDLLNNLVTYADDGGGVIGLHHGLYNDVDNPTSQNKDMLLDQLFGIQSTEDGWGATRTDYNLYSTDYGHFVSSYLINYPSASSSPGEWSENSLSTFANTAYSTLSNFSINDELYTNMTLTNTVAIGRDVNQLTPLFSNDHEESIAHTSGVTRIFDGDMDGTSGKVVAMEMGERQTNLDISSRYGQIIRNAVLWASSEETVVEKSAQTITFNPSPVEYVYGAANFNLSGTSSSTLDVSYSSSDNDVLSVSGSTISINGAGMATITASQAGNSDFEAATNVDIQFTVAQAPMTITADHASKTHGQANPSFTLSYDTFLNGDDASDINLPSISTTASLNSNAGTYPIELTEGSADNYILTLVNGTLTVNKANQSITFNSLAEKHFEDSDFDLEAISSSDLSVTYVSSNPTKASINGNTVTIHEAGTSTITALQTGNMNYNPAPNIQQILVINKLTQAINITAIADKIVTDNPIEVIASVDTGLPIVLEVDGVATIDGTTITLTGESGSVLVTATQAGSINYEATMTSISFNVTDPSKTNQTITFEEISEKTYGDVFTVVANSTSELPITFSVLSGPITITEDEVNIIGVGMATIVASQAGNSEFNPSSITKSFTIIKSDQILEITEIEDKLVTDDPFDIVATVNTAMTLSYEVSGPATINNNSITLSGEVGNVIVTVSQSGSDNYNEVSESVSFDVTQISKQDQTITFDAIADKIYGDSFEISATASSNLDIVFSVVNGPVVLNGNSVTITGVGEVTLVANQSGNNEFYTAPEVTQSFTIAKADQTIILEPVADKMATDTSFEITATIDTNLDLTFDTDGPASIQGSMVTLSGEAGTVSIMASQGGNQNYNAASASISFEVTQDEVLGLDNDLLNSIEIYPNPVQDHLNILGKEKIQIRISNLKGQTLIEDSLIQGQINMSHLKAGMYLMEIQTDKSKVQMRLIKE